MSTAPYEHFLSLGETVSEKRRLLFCMVAFLVVFPACTSTPHVTFTKKSGVEQLLVARAMDRAIREENLNLEGKKIFVDAASLTSDVNAYFKKAMEHQVLRKGGLLTGEKSEADVIGSVLVNCAGTDGKQFFFGIPSIPVPLTVYSTPQISLISGSDQKGYAEIEVILFSPDHGKKQETGPLIGKSRFKHYSILFISITREDIYRKEDNSVH